MQRTIVWYVTSVFVLLALLFGVGFHSYAQSTGVIKGKVTGDGNLPLANVPVKAFYQENFTGIIVWTYVGQATTDNTGAYTIPNLSVGIYHISFNEYPPLVGYFAEFYNKLLPQILKSQRRLNLFS